MTGFHEIRFPERFAYGSTRTLDYVCVVYENSRHVEHRVGLSPVGRLMYLIMKENLTFDDVAELEAFYRGRKGKTYGFRFKDFEGYRVTDESLTYSSGTTVQLIKTFDDGLETEVKTILKPVAGTVTLKRDGTAFASSGNWTLDTETGVVTFTADQTGHTFTWSGEYDIPVRFNSTMATTRMSRMVAEWRTIELVELLV